MIVENGFCIQIQKLENGFGEIGSMWMEVWSMVDHGPRARSKVGLPQRIEWIVR